MCKNRASLPRRRFSDDVGLKEGYPHRVLEMWARDRVEVVVSHEILLSMTGS